MFIMAKMSQISTVKIGLSSIAVTVNASGYKTVDKMHILHLHSEVVDKQLQNA